MITNGTIFKIKKYALHDGPGIRTTVFLKGCPLNCWWCHNPEGQEFKPEGMKKTIGLLDKMETIGKRIVVEDLLSEIEKDVIFFDESGGGVTFSGGEPLSQPDFLMSLLKACREKEIHTAVDTSGYAPSGVFEAMIGHVRMVLFDLKIMDETRHCHYTGVSNKPILHNLETLAGSNVPVRIRFPMIQGITDLEENIKQVAEVALTLDHVEGIDILPYHKIAGHKYRRLGKLNRLNDVKPPEEAVVNQTKDYFQSLGFQVNIGG